MKLGIIVDSSCGLTKKETEKKGWKYLPLYMTIDGKDYADGIDILPKQYYEMIDVNMDVKTSATPPGIIEDILKKASKEFDQVIVYALSKELSSQTSNISVFSKEYKNVHVLQSKGVGYGIVYQCETLEEMAQNSNSIEDILNKAELMTNTFWGFAIPKTMDWLVKGGRASAGAASLANMLKIVPIIKFKDGKLDKGGKGRVFKKTVVKAAKDLATNVKDDDAKFIFMSAGNDEAKELLIQVEEAIGKKLEIFDFPPIIGNHIGKGAVAILSMKIK